MVDFDFDLAPEAVVRPNGRLGPDGLPLPPNPIFSNLFCNRFRDLAGVVAGHKPCSIVSVDDLSTRSTLVSRIFDALLGQLITTDCYGRRIPIKRVREWHAALLDAAARRGLSFLPCRPRTGIVFARGRERHAAALAALSYGLPESICLAERAALNYR